MSATTTSSLPLNAPRILFNDFARQWRDTRNEVIDAVADVGASGWYILGKNVDLFEQSLAAFWSHRYAVGVASGLDAIELSLRAAGCEPGQKVLTTPLSAFATTLAILKIGAIPVFVDCDESGLCDLDAAEKVLEQRPDIRYFLPVHLYGQSLDMARLDSLRDRFELTVVEDCAQSIAAAFKGRPTGTSGQFAATSFYPTKNLGALGDGGAVLTSSEAHASQIRVLRDYGQTGKYRHSIIGYNSRLDELHAAVLNRVYLPKVPEWTRRRREIAAMYRERIENSNIRCLPCAADCESCYHLFPVLVEAGAKTSFMEHLQHHGIAAAEHYPMLIPDQPALAGAPHEVIAECVQARRLCEHEVSLPIHPYLRQDEIARIVAACNSWR